METIQIIIGVLGSAFALVMTVLSIITFRKPRRITLLSTLISGVISLLTLPLVMLLGGLRLNLLMIIPLSLLGLLLGFLRGQTMHLSWQGKNVIGRNSILFLGIWGLSLTFSQALNLLGSPLLASMGFIPVVFATGLQLGFYGNLFLRRLLMQFADSSNGRMIIGIAGGLALALLFLISAFISVPSLIDTFPEWNSETSAAEAMPLASEPVASLPTSTAFTQPETTTTTGFLPVTGQLVIDCAAEVQQERERRPEYAPAEGPWFFDEVYKKFDLSYDMQIDLSERTYSFIYEHHSIQRDPGFNPAFDDEPCPQYGYTSLDAQGVVREDGWFSGNYYFHHKSEICTDPIVMEGDNEFYGFINDDLTYVTFCQLPTGSWVDEDDYVVEYDQLISAGKEALVPNCYYPEICNICAIEAIVPL